MVIGVQKPVGTIMENFRALWFEHMKESCTNHDPKIAKYSMSETGSKGIFSFVRSHDGYNESNLQQRQQ